MKSSMQKVYYSKFYSTVLCYNPWKAWIHILPLFNNLLVVYWRKNGPARKKKNQCLKINFKRFQTGIKSSMI